MKTSTLLGLSLLCSCAVPSAPAFAATNGPARSPDNPDAPPYTMVSGNRDDLFKYNEELKALLAKPDPAAIKAFQAKYPFGAPLITANGLPPANVEGDFLIGPNHPQAPELTPMPGVPQGKVYTFTMISTDSKIYPGIDRDPNTFGTVDPNNPNTLLVPSSHAAPYSRLVTVYVPAQYVPGTPAPFIVKQDGADPFLPAILDNMIAQGRVPAMIAVEIAHGGRASTDPLGGSDAQGSQRGLEYDTMSGKYAEFVETEVLPLVEKQYNVTLTKDPEGRAAWGGSSGASAALEMAWYHNDLYHRVLSYSGTFINQQWPYNPETPHGAWGFHDKIIPESDPKPIRIWMEVGDMDLLNPNIMRDNMHDWVIANERMAKILKAKGYHYQFTFVENAGHTDGPTRLQTLPEALEWLWQGYPR